MMLALFWVPTFILGITTISAQHTSTAPTSSSPTGPGLECSCYPCYATPGVFDKHIQNIYCDSAAVVVGKVLRVTTLNADEGIWNYKDYNDTHRLRHQAEHRPSHFKIKVKISHVYKQDQHTELKTSDKIIVRSIAHADCPSCDNVIERHDMDQINDQRIEVGLRYVFFLPKLSYDFGAFPESLIARCTPVWRYTTDLEKSGIPSHRLRMLQKTDCDKCRVGGCLQNRCDRTLEGNTCNMGEYELMDLFQPFNWKSCYVLEGMCYYDPESDKCFWKRTKSLSKCHETYEEKQEGE